MKDKLTPRDLTIRPLHPDIHALHQAILADDVDFISNALDNGTDPDTRLMFNLPMLHLAAIQGKVEVARELITRGANANIQTSEGYSALHLAAHYGDEQIVQALIPYADTKLTDSDDGFMAIHAAAARGNVKALNLLSQLSDVDVRTVGDETPLFCAVRRGHIECVEALAEQGADVNVRCAFGKCTPLMMAAMKNDTTMTSALLDLGAQLDESSEADLTALQIAARKSHVAVLSLLLSHSELTGSSEEDKCRALYLACIHSNSEAALMLLQHISEVGPAPVEFGDFSVLHVAVSRGLIDVVLLLLDRGADVGTCDRNGNSPLVLAIDGGHSSIIKALADHGANINHQNPNTGLTALHWAVKCGDTTITDQLLRYGAITSLLDLGSIDPLDDVPVQQYEACKKLIRGEIPSDYVLAERPAIDAIPSDEDHPVLATETSSNAVSEKLDFSKYKILDIPTQVALQDRIASVLSKVEHEDVFCDGPLCNEKSQIHAITGIRYKCLVCEDVDLCADCLWSCENNHDTSHNMVRCFLPTDFDHIESNNIDEAVLQELLSSHGVSPTTEFVATIAQTQSRKPDSLLPDDFFRYHLAMTFLTLQTPHKQDVRSKELLVAGDVSQAKSMAYIQTDAAGLAVSIARSSLPHEVDTEEIGDEVIEAQHTGGTVCTSLFQNVEPFDYGSLPEFYEAMYAGKLVTRVLDLNPGQFDDDLCLRLRVIDPSVERYTALSYTWKETSFERKHFEYFTKQTNKELTAGYLVKHVLYIEVESRRYYLKVSTGLRDALRRLRSESGQITLWADQISINQADYAEREYQVARMRYIYNRADEVILWTGDENDDTGRVFTLLQAVGSSVHDLKPDAEHELVLRDVDLEVPHVDSVVWKGILEFLSRPVFFRCWVIQELVVAGRVRIRCGQYNIDHSTLVRAMWALIAAPQPNPWATSFEPTMISFVSVNKPKFRNLMSIDVLRDAFHSSKENTMEQLLYICKPFEASDPRDKIFALMGIRGKSEILQTNILRPDYTKSTREVFVEATKVIMLGAKSWGVCGLLNNTEPKTITGLPSWVPDYSSTQEEVTAFSSPIPHCPYNAGGTEDFLAEWNYKDHASLLLTTTYQAGIIAKVTDHVFARSESEDSKQFIEGWVELASTIATYPTGEDVALAFSRTCVGDYIAPDRCIPMPLSYHTTISKYITTGYFDHIYNAPQKEEGRPKPPPPRTIVPFMEPYLKSLKAQSPATASQDIDDLGAMRSVCQNRRFFTTSSGFFGIGPSSIREDDEVHVLASGKVPFVLRRVDDDGNDNDNDKDHDATVSISNDVKDIARRDGVPLYSMLGETYVHGIMQGEIFEREEFAWNKIYMH